MLDDQQIRARIRAYTDGTLSAAALEDWLESESWDEGTLRAPERQLANDALRLLAEFGNGDWTEGELAEQLGSLSRLYWFVHAPRVVRSDAMTTVIRHDRRLAGTGRSHASECA
jgi:hypothetical protein